MLLRWLFFPLFTLFSLQISIPSQCVIFHSIPFHVISFCSIHNAAAIATATAISLKWFSKYFFIYHICDFFYFCYHFADWSSTYDFPFNPLILIAVLCLGSFMYIPPLEATLVLIRGITSHSLNETRTKGSKWKYDWKKRRKWEKPTNKKKSTEWELLWWESECTLYSVHI